MHLLYLDDSGSVGNAADTHVILAGAAVFERQTHWFSDALDKVALSLWPDSPAGLEFRGADIYAGRKQWRGIDRPRRLEAYKTALNLIAASRHIRLFWVASIKGVTPSAAS